MNYTKYDKACIVHKWREPILQTKEFEVGWKSSVTAETSGDYVYTTDRCISVNTQVQPAVHQ